MAGTLIPASGCPRDTYLGRLVPIEFALACGDVDPTTLEYLPIGANRSGDLSLEWDTVDGTNADSKGAVRENYATYQSVTISGDGVLKARDDLLSNHKLLFKHVAKPVGGQPVAWIRITYPDITIYVYCIISSFGRATQFDDLATYTWEATSTGSVYGVVVEDTPDPTAPAPTGVTVAPSTASVAVGATTNLSATVAPAGATQSVAWTSSDNTKATVSSSGVVTGVAAGAATITATSSVDGTKKSTAAITVTA